MDKRTVLAVVISTLVIVVGFSIQNLIISSRQAAQESPEGQDLRGSTSEQPATNEANIGDNEPAQGTSQNQNALRIQEVEDAPQCNPYFENDTVQVRFNSNGATIRSMLLTNHTTHEGKPVEMIFRGNTTHEPLLVTIGEDNRIPLSGEYHCSVSDNAITFYKHYTIPEVQSEPFKITKTFQFYPQEYLFELEISLENSINRPIPIEFGSSAYQVYFGPQIGPEFAQLDSRQEYRNYYQYINNRRRRVRIRSGQKVVDSSAEWVAVEGKYFAFIAIPHSGVSDITLINTPQEGLPATSEVRINRLPIKSSFETDSYLFYLGPKTKNELAKYNNSQNNQRGLGSLELNRVIGSRPLIGWLETILKWGLQSLYYLIPNYGIAIIILTIIVKILLLPLTAKSQRSSMRMQELAPKINEIRQQYQGDQQRINMELAGIYKREGVNPASGCLPLLVQFPFFIAMFGIFNNHFELRGATFIPGWINDLSQPESILNFGNFTLPILGWNDLRLLPILFVLTQVLSGIIMKNPSQNQQQAKMLAIVMPVVFFFLLYNMPAGLLLYWIVTNVLTIIQQAGVTLKTKRHD